MHDHHNGAIQDGDLQHMKVG